MYEGIVYFAGPKSRWSGKIDSGEVLARIFSPWRWLARIQMLNIHGSLRADRCGYALLRNGNCVEQYDPPS